MFGDSNSVGSPEYEPVRLYRKRRYVGSCQNGVPGSVTRLKLPGKNFYLKYSCCYPGQQYGHKKKTAVLHVSEKKDSNIAFTISTY